MRGDEIWSSPILCFDQHKGLGMEHDRLETVKLDEYRIARWRSVIDQARHSVKRRIGIDHLNDIAFGQHFHDSQWMRETFTVSESQKRETVKILDHLIRLAKR